MELRGVGIPVDFAVYHPLLVTQSPIPASNPILHMRMRERARAGEERVRRRRPHCRPLSSLPPSERSGSGNCPKRN